MANTGNVATISGNVLTDSGLDLSTKADLVAGLVPASQLPSYVDDVLEYANLASFPVTGEIGKIYVGIDTNQIYRWSGSTYIEISPSVGTVWGGIGGTLSNQTDLQTALDGKQASLSGTGFVKISGTTISYDNSTYLTGITSGQVTTALGYTPYNATNPSGYLTASTVLSTELTPYVVGANTAVTATDTIETAIEKLQGQTDARVPNTRTLTINGTAFDLSANRSWTIAASPGGNANTVQFNNASAFDGAVNVTINSSDLVLANNTSKTAAPASSVKLYGHNMAGRIMPGAINSAGVGYPIQPLLSSKKISYYTPKFGTADQASVGMSLAGSGTLVGPALSQTNIVTSSARLSVRQTPANSANQSWFKNNTFQITRGSIPGIGGFTVSVRFSLGTSTGTVNYATARFFVGFRGSAANLTDVSASTYNNTFGVGFESASTTLQLYTGAATMTLINTGLTFSRSPEVELFEFIAYCPPNASFITYQVINIGTGATFSTTVTDSAQLPGSINGLCYVHFLSAAGTSTETSFNLHSLYVETDY